MADRPANNVDDDDPLAGSLQSPKLQLTRKVQRGGIQQQQNNNNTATIKNSHEPKVSADPRKRSPCGAPIPSFSAELDRLEKELQEDDEEDQKRLQRKELREQQRKLFDKEKGIQSHQSKKEAGTAGLLSLSDDDDDDKLLTFNFRGAKSSGGCSAVKAVSRGHASVATSKKRKTNSCMEEEVSPLREDEGSAGFDDPFHSSPLAESTNQGTFAKTAEPKSLESILQSAVLEIFLRSNIHTCTVKKVCEELEDQFAIKLDKAKKKAVRERLTELIQQQTQLLSPPAPALTMHSEKRNTNTVATIINGVEGKESNGTAARTALTNARKIASGDVSDVPTAKASVPTCNPTVTSITTVAAGATDAPEAPVPKRRARKPKTVPDSSAACTLTGTSTAPLAAGKKRRAATARSISITTTAAAAATNTTTTTTTRAPKRGKGNCTLCNNCPCLANTPATISTLNLAQSDAAVEKALIRRLQKLEQTSDRYEEQAEAVRRKLKKHRREMWKKMEPPQLAENASSSLRQSRFLPDVEEMDRNIEAHPGSAQLDVVTVSKARAALFSFAPTYQPTLTQMLGCRSKKVESCEADGVVASKTELESIAEEKATQLADADNSIADSQDAMDLDQDDGEADECCANFSDDNALVDIQRVEVRNGVDTLEESTRIWGACATECGYKCLWDRIFEDPADAEDLDLEQLETLMAQVQSQRSLQPGSPVRHAMLTQRGRLLADEIMVQISSDSERISRLDSACPTWKENVLFALHQTTFGDVSDALESVREAQARLRRGKEGILRAIEAQEAALDVYAEALNQSLTRFDCDNCLSQGSRSTSTGRSTSQDQVLPSPVDDGLEETPDVKTLSSSCRTQEASQIYSYPLPRTSEASPVAAR